MSQPTSVDDRSKADTNALFKRLRKLMENCGPDSSKHDLALVGISACIVESIDTRPRIIGVLRTLGLHPQHVAIILNDGTGNDPQRHRWQRDAEGRYSLHEEGPQG